MEFINKHTEGSIDIQYVMNLIHPRTPYGLQLKRDLKPYKRGDEVLLKKELDRVEKIIETLKLYPEKIKIVANILKHFKEIRNSLKRIKDGMVLDEIELFEIKNFAMNLNELFLVQEGIKEIPCEIRIIEVPEIEQLLDPEKTVSRTFFIYECYSDALRELRHKRADKQREFDSEKKRIISEIQKAVGAVPKLSGELIISKKDPEIIQRARECSYLSEESQTVLSAAFKVKIDDKAADLMEEIEEIKAMEASEEYRVKKYLTSEIGKNLSKLEDSINRLAGFDFTISKAELALKIGGIRPKIREDIGIHIKNGRHLRLEEVLKKKGRNFTPISLGASKGVTIITGANMGGKTVSMKLSGMLSMMTHYGLYVPAEEFETCLFDFIYFSIGDMQCLDSGLSTFGAEVSGMIDILKHSQYRGLILIDELARGTNPKEGYAISRAIVRYLKDKSSITLFTTHFEGITLEKDVEHLQVRGLKDVDFNGIMNKIKEGFAGLDLVLDYMDYRLEKVKGVYDAPKDALNIAWLMGLDDIILKWAEEIMISGKEE